MYSALLLCQKSSMFLLTMARTLPRTRGPTTISKMVMQCFGQEFLKCRLFGGVAHGHDGTTVLPPSDHLPYVLHQYREHNAFADALANRAAALGTVGAFVRSIHGVKHIAVQFDGSFRSSDKAASVALIWGCEDLPATSWSEIDFRDSWHHSGMGRTEAH